jgi:hypothetical protein
VANPHPGRCSQCGAVNEAGSRACHACGKWPSLFDLQSTVEPEELVGADAYEPEFDDEEIFETEAFEPETYDAEAYAPPFETGSPESAEPEVVGESEGEHRRRFPRWAITAIWVLGIAIWLLVNALGDR